ncbi:30S ribosomal protein S4 [Tumebacillus sp. ITR2]|uniref:Small ribosomal subunit protein uS4 n=1 Tax=Tumebacillus amylolyticus TaxID=2801339 RepID=A0ABS1J734_9BACL|nr:30S ribosomal protein S4 [Tumebacillus amylolyticus]MBL0386095.1 30S ribosomal protein S4 [Tumebacillus amylolyticus]
MARTTGPKHKVCRQVGQALCGSPKCPVHKRPYPPGQHGPTKRKKVSEYGVQLQEKQKLKFIYGVLEKQFRAYYEEAARQKGITGENLLRILNSRLDYLVYQAGFARTLAGARQLVNHGHVLVNGSKVDIPSFQVRPGNVISLREKSRDVTIVKESLELAPARPGYLDWNENEQTATYARLPHREEMPQTVQEHLIIEFYSR